jgi:small-conductance mechanosensitive channel
MTDQSIPAQNLDDEDDELTENEEEVLETDSDSEDEDDSETGDDLATKALAQAQKTSMAGSTSASSSTPAAQKALGETLTALQNVIERNADQLDEIKGKIKQFREELKNVLENDEILSDVEQQASQMTQKVKERKSQLQGSAQVTQIKSNLMEVIEQKKEVEEALNNHLLNLYQVTGTKTFDTSSGQTREFSIKASIKGSRKPQNE